MAVELIAEKAAKKGKPRKKPAAKKAPAKKSTGQKEGLITQTKRIYRPLMFSHLADRGPVTGLPSAVQENSYEFS